MSFVSAPTTSALPSRKPTRQPAIENDFVIVYSSTAQSFAPRHLQDRRRLVAVEGGVGVREVVHQDHVALAGQVDEPLHLVELDGRRRRVVREATARPPAAWATELPGLACTFDEVLPAADAAPAAPPRRRSSGPQMWIG